MTLHFQKYQGTGNDFIIIDNRQHEYHNLPVARLCHPKFGIGADGLMLLQNKAGFDFEMVYYNSDGNLSSMCGNGGRCLVDFARRLRVFDHAHTHFIATDGPHEANWSPDQVSLKMSDVPHVSETQGHYVLNTGSPHYVIFTPDTESLDIVKEGRAVRYSDTYKQEGINVNMVQIMGPDTIRVRTYERGVENETLSCGTGVTASAIAFALKQKLTINKVNIITPGGNLSVSFDRDGNSFSNVWLTGPAVKVFEGSIDL